MSKKQPRVTRRAILDSAAKEMVDSGLRSASLDRILSRAGVTKGALYHHFGSKSGLTAAVIREAFGEPLLARWRQGLEQGDDPLEALDRLIAALPFEPPLASLALQCDPGDDASVESFREIYRMWTELVTKALERARALGILGRSTDIGTVSRWVIATSEGCAGYARITDEREAFATLLSDLRGRLSRLRIAKAETSATAGEPAPVRRRKKPLTRRESTPRDPDFLFVG